MRRAEWRMRADDPKSLLGWWWRAALEGEISGLSAFGLLSGALLMKVEPLLGLIPAAAALTVDFLGRRYHRSSQLDSMLDDPPPAYRCLTGIEYWRQGTRIGSDVMALSFTEGWLYAEGVRSTFAVRASDIPTLRPPMEHKGTFGLADGTFIVVLNEDEAFRNWLWRWHTQGAVSPGEPIFPPARVHPQEVAKKAALTMSTSIFLFATIAVCLNLVNPSDRWGAAGVGLGLFVLSAMWAGKKLARVRRVDALAQSEIQALAEQVPPLQVAAERTIEGSRAEARDTLAG